MFVLESQLFARLKLVVVVVVLVVVVVIIIIIIIVGQNKAPEFKNAQCQASALMRCPGQIQRLLCEYFRKCCESSTWGNIQQIERYLSC